MRSSANRIQTVDCDETNCLNNVSVAFFFVSLRSTMKNATEETMFRILVFLTAHLLTTPKCQAGIRLNQNFRRELGQFGGRFLYWRLLPPIGKKRQEYSGGVRKKYLSGVLSLAPGLVSAVFLNAARRSFASRRLPRLFANGENRLFSLNNPPIGESFA